MSKELDDLLRSAESTNFSLNTQPTEQTGGAIQPLQQPEDGGIFDLGDTLMAIPRGVVGAGKSAYGLIDALALDALPDWENNPLGESKSVVGGLVEGISEFATGMFALSGAVGAIGKGVKGAEWLLNAGEMAKTGKTALSLQGRIIAGAATDFVAFDGNSGRLTDLVAKIPGLEEPVTQYLGFLTTNEEDGEILGRVKNTLEGAGVGAIVDGVIKSLRFLKEYRTHLADGKTMDEALKAADKVQPIVDLRKALKMSDDFVFAEASPFKGPLLDEALNSPEVRITINPDGTPSPVPVMFHATPADFTELAPWSHVGTAKAASDRFRQFNLGNAGNGPSGLGFRGENFDIPNTEWRTVAVAADAKNPLQVDDRLANDLVYLEKQAEDQTAYVDPDKYRDLAERAGLNAGTFENEGLLAALKEKGYDSISYVNDVEDAGSLSYIIPEPSKQSRIVPPHEIKKNSAAAGDLGSRPTDPGPEPIPSDFPAAAPEYTDKQAYFQALDEWKAKTAARAAWDSKNIPPVFVALARRTPQGLELGAAKPSTLTIPWSGPDLKSWVNLHGTLLGNPLTLIDIDKSTGEASIGILLRPDLVQDETVRKILKSVAEAPDMTPGELGAAADEIYRQGKRTQQEFGFAKTEGPAGAGEPPKPPAPGSAGPEGEDFGRSPNSGAQQPAGTRATPHQIFLSEGGWDTNQAEQVKQFFGGEFSEAVAERGRIIHNFNSAQPAQVFESGEVMAHPVKYTDAVNPRKLTAFERTGLAIQRLGINLGRMKDNDVDIASTVRVVHDMMLAMLKAEDPKFAGETMAGMWERVSRQLDIVNGKPTIEEQRQWLLRQAHAAGQNIDEAAAMAAASLEVSVGAVRDVVTTLADLFKRGPDVADWEWADLAERMGLANDAMQANKVISNSLARGLRLQNFKIEPSSVKRMTATQLRQDSKALNEVLLRHGGVDAIKDMAMKIYALGPDVDIRKVSVVLNKIEASFGSRTMRLMSDVHYASLLSGLRTHVTTLLSNTFTAMYLPFEEAVAGQFGRIMAKTPEEAKVFKAQVAEAFGTYSAMVTALPEAIEAAKAAFKNPDGILSPKSSLFDISKRSRVPGMSAANLGVNNPQAAEFVDRLGAAMGVFTKALGASDEGFKNLAYRSVSRSKLLSMGVQAGKSGPELAKWVEESMDRLIYKGQALSQDQMMRRARDIVREKHGVSGIQATEKALRIVSEWQKSDWYKELSPLAEFALARAEEGTFTTALRPGSLGNDFKAFLNRQPVLKFAVPFVQTPINIMLFAGQRIDAVSVARWNLETKVLPMVGRWTGNTKLIGRDGSAFAASRTRFLREMASGDPKLRSQAMGRMILGSSFAMMVGSLGIQGLITGRGPSDPDQRKALSEAGWLPYSFKFGDTYVSYSRLDPFATIIGTIADIQDATRYLPDDKQEDLNELGMGLLVSLANNLTNKTYLQGVSNLVQALSDPGARLERSAQAFVSSFMPNLLRDVGDTLNEAIEGDTAVKEIRSVTDAVLNKIPYFSETRLDPRRNALGEPIKKIQALGRDTLGALAAYPVPISARSSSDPLLQEMANLEYGFSNPSSQRNGYDMAEIMLPNNRSAHDRWLENSSRVRIGGKTLRETLENLIKTPGYQALSNFNVSDQKSPRVEVVNSIIQRYRRAAFEQTMQEVPELRAAELNFRARKLAARSGIELR